MYNQIYINSIDESILNDIFNKRRPLPSINSTSCEDKHIYFVFQHYLLKKFETNSDKSKAIEFLMLYYNDLKANPSLFVTSPLLKNNAMDQIIKDSNLRESIKTRRNSYYSSRLIPTFREKSRNNQLSLVEKEIYYAILIHNLKNPKAKEVIEEEIDRIIDRATVSSDGSFKDTGIKNLSPMEIQFYTYYLTLFYDSKIFIPAFIGTAQENYNGYENGQMIFLNTNGQAALSLADYTKTVLHESRHVTQEIDSKSKTNKKALEMAQTNLFIKYLPEKGKSYKCNYKYSSIELDAEQLGHYNASLFFYMRKRKELEAKVRQRKVERYDKRNYYAFMRDSNNQPTTVDRFVVENLDQIMRTHPEEMANYPVLRELYTPNGERRPLSEYLINKTNSFRDNNFYTNFINYGIQNGELDKIDLINATKSDKRDLLKSLSGVYRDYVVDKLFAHGTDNPDSSINKNQIIITTNYAINQAMRIIDYVDKNFDKFMFAYKGETLDHTNPMFNLIYDLRDHTLDKITNPVLLASDKFKKKYDELKQKVDHLIEKYNKAYIESRFSKVGIDLSKEVEINGVGNITVEDYIYNYLVPNMDSHQYVYINGQQYYSSDILSKLKAYADSNSDKNQK